MSIFCVQIQPPVSVADDTHSPCFMFNAHVLLHASLYLVLAWGHASYKTISLSIAFNSFRSLESFPSFYPFLLFMLPFFPPLWSHHPHTMVNSDDDHWSKYTCSVKINSVCITIPKTALIHNPFQISHQYKYQYFLHSHHLRQYNHHRRHQHGQLDMVITWKCSVASRWVVCVRGRDGSLRGSSSGETSASTTSSVKKDFEERFWIWLDDILWKTVGKVKKKTCSGASLAK